MRVNLLITSLLLLGAGSLLGPRAAAATFGQLVTIGGSASDIALDEGHGYLYIADFGAGVIDIMSLADNTIHSQIQVPAQPSSLAMSPDGQFLLVGGYATAPVNPNSLNGITLIHTADRTQQHFAFGDGVIGVAFYLDPQNNQLAMILGNAGVYTMDPVSGVVKLQYTYTGLAEALPVPFATYPGTILKGSLATSADGHSVWGIADAGQSPQLIFRYDTHQNFQSTQNQSPQIAVYGYVSSPSLLPRVAVSDDGTTALVGWSLLSADGLKNGYYNSIYLLGRYPNVLAATTITGAAYDSQAGPYGTVYAQFPDANQPTGPPLAPSLPASQASSVSAPALLIMDADNLTFRDRINIPEDMVGRAILNAARSVLYAISESGVMVLPVGQINQYNRVAATQPDVVVQSSFCNRGTVTQTLSITDPGGGQTDFTITPSSSNGVTISPSSGVTPATVQVRVDTSAFAGQNGTSVLQLAIASAKAVNQPQAVRLLINNPDSSQRGTVVDVPGSLTDIVPDQARNRFYIARHDQNEVLVFDGASAKQIATFRTYTSPTMMSLSSDGSALLVGHDDSQLVAVYDLNGMQRQFPVVLPGGHYGRSIAQSNARTFVLSRDEALGGGTMDNIDLVDHIATILPTLGIYKNHQMSATAVIVPSPNQGTILLADVSGSVALYTAAQDTWVNSRKDLPSLSGGIAASSYDTYVVGNNIFNSSLVPYGTIIPTTSMVTGFAFVDQGGYFTMSAASAASPSVIERMTTLQSGGSAQSPVYMSEAALGPTASTVVSTSSGSGSSGSSGTSGSSGSSGTSGTGTGTGTGSSGSGSTSAYNLTAFTRTVAPLSSSGTIIVLTTSGFTVLSQNYAAAVAPPLISSLVNAANNTAPVAPGGLISVYGSNMSPVNLATSQIPLPTALGNSCLSVNGTPVPLLYVSNQQINAQLPFNVAGNASISVHTPGGVSDNYLFAVQPAAPSVFMSGVAGPVTGLATIMRADNNQLVTPTNPLHPKDTVVIYLTGMGLTYPPVDSGIAAPSSPLSAASIQPTLSLGGAGLNVTYAGLVPGEVGVYQINATVPAGAPQGLSIPLVINQGGATTTLNVRVVTP